MVIAVFVVSINTKRYHDHATGQLSVGERSKHGYPEYRKSISGVAKKKKPAGLASGGLVQ